jgi:hypothetical protein
LGFPGSADLALSVGASYPGVYARPPQPGVPPARDVLAWFSSRGGELAKPDIITPGIAFSSVPRWNMGDEIKPGTSMASPHAAGLAACLVSAFAQQDRRLSAVEVVQALRVSARPFGGVKVIDDGAGVPVLEAAYQWLAGGHQGSIYDVKAQHGTTAAFRRNGFASAEDTVETFTVRHLAGRRAAEFALRSDVTWLSVDPDVGAEPRATQIAVSYKRSALTNPGVYVGTVTALNPRDTIAGPLFELINTVIVPTDLSDKVLFDERRTVGPGAVQRYFLRVPNDATLRATVTLPDSQAQQAIVRLFEPNGEPARSASDDIYLGQSEPGTAVVTVRAEDVVPGVYELDVIAQPLGAAIVTTRAALGPVALARKQSGLEASSVTEQGSTASGEVLYRLLGAEREYAIAGRGQPAESTVVRAPRWAKRMEVDVDLSPDLWDQLTDFAVTVFDSSGQQLPGGNHPANYAFTRISVALSDSLTDVPLTIELFPAFARLPAHVWNGTLHVRFLGPDEPAGEGGPLSVVPGGRSVIRLPNPPSLDLPDGFGTLIETRVTTMTGTMAARRSVVAPASHGAGGLR